MFPDLSLKSLKAYVLYLMAFALIFGIFAIAEQATIDCKKLGSLGSDYEALDVVKTLITSNNEADIIIDEE